MTEGPAGCWALVFSSAFRPTPRVQLSVTEGEVVWDRKGADTRESGSLRMEFDSPALRQIWLGWWLVARTSARVSARAGCDRHILQATRRAMNVEPIGQCC